MNPVASLGGWAVDVVLGLGRFSRFSASIVGASLSPFRGRRLMDEIYEIGVRSLPIICISGASVGSVLGLQGYASLARFGAEDLLGSGVGLVLIRELGPVVTSLLVTGRAGSAIAAQIGAMVATEQLDGLRMMSVNPVGYVVAPKALAMIIVMPLLSALFISFGLLGGYLVGSALLGVDGGRYLSGLESVISFEDDVLISVLKSLVFGALVGAIATYYGFMARPNSAGVSSATTTTVVIGSVATLIVDYVITALWGV